MFSVDRFVCWSSIRDVVFFFDLISADEIDCADEYINQIGERATKKFASECVLQEEGQAGGAGNVAVPTFRYQSSRTATVSGLLVGVLM